MAMDEPSRVEPACCANRFAGHQVRKFTGDGLRLIHLRFHHDTGSKFLKALRIRVLIHCCGDRKLWDAGGQGQSDRTNSRLMNDDRAAR